MSYIDLNGSVWWPPGLSSPAIGFSGNAGGRSTLTIGTMDAANEDVAMIGRVYWADKSASAKTFSTSSSISFRTGLVTFADASTNLRIGIQDVATASVALIQPDGTFDVYADIAGNSGTITSSDDNVVKAITMTSGSKSITHGDLVAIVFTMTARGGADSVVINGNYATGTTMISPSAIKDEGAGWVDAGSIAPNVMLIADDGTRGILYGSHFVKTGSAYALQSSSSPNRRGLIFQMPFACKVSSLWFVGGGASSDADASLKLYSTPLGTPTALATVTILGEQLNNSANERPILYLLPAEIELSGNTDYAVMLEGTGAADISVGYVELNHADDRTVQGFTNCRGGYRTGDSGAFTESTTILPLCGVGLSSVFDGATPTYIAGVM